MSSVFENLVDSFASVDALVEALGPHGLDVAALPSREKEAAFMRSLKDFVMTLSERSLRALVKQAAEAARSQTSTPRDEDGPPRVLDARGEAGLLSRENSPTGAAVGFRPPAAGRAGPEGDASGPTDTTTSRPVVRRRVLDVDDDGPDSDAASVFRTLDLSAFDETKRAQRAALARERLLRSADASEEASERAIALTPTWAMRVRPFEELLPVQAAHLRDVLADVRYFEGAPQVAPLHPVLAHAVDSPAERILVSQLAATQQFVRNMLFLLNDLRDRAERFSEHDAGLGSLADAAMLVTTSFAADRVADLRGHLYAKCHSREPMGIQPYLSAMDALERRHSPRMIGSSLRGFGSLDELRQAGFVGQRREGSGSRRGRRHGGGAPASRAKSPPASAQRDSQSSPAREQRSPQKDTRGRGNGGGRGGSAAATPGRD